MQFLKDTNEFVLLIPGNSEQNFAISLAVVMRVHEKICMRQFSENSLEVERPIRVLATF
jgi:hypothetical protein